MDQMTQTFFATQHLGTGLKNAIKHEAIVQVWSVSIELLSKNESVIPCA
jgi:hypothetical protein